MSSSLRNDIKINPNKVWILDGGLATEMQRHGFPVQPPFWTSEFLMSESALSQLTDVHYQYIDSGADIITANTFRTNSLSLVNSTDFTASELTNEAIRCVSEARNKSRKENVLIAASIAPVGDCYIPADTPSLSTLIHEHRKTIDNIVRSGADLILAETLNSSVEAEIILQEAQLKGIDCLISFVCDESGDLLNGERFENFVDRLLEYQPIGILVNCTTLTGTFKALEKLSLLSPTTHLGAYPNVEDRSNIPANTHTDINLANSVDSNNFQKFCLEIVSLFNLKFIGGCCGSTPKYIKQLSTSLNSSKEHGKLNGTLND